ncbi:MAG TPA: HAMP domain-containing sensor histidine kinase [Kofleriaceae bacterium]|nr:HAMP domain-containing sensor histidine kinase [Kofleriaceae bacterium]
MSDPEPCATAAYLRAHKDEICVAFEQEVAARIEPLRALSRPAIMDHLPEVLEAIAAWIEGREQDAWVGFRLLADGHALQRLGHGIDAEVLAVEYSGLRRVILHALLAVPSTPAVRAELIRFDSAMDLAINHAMHLFGRRRSAARERFVAILAHDLRSPLGAVLLSGQALQQLADDDSRVASLAARIVRAAERMNGIVDDVLALARSQLGGGIPATPTAHDLGALCRLAADELRAGHPGLEVTVDVEGDLRGAWDGDRVHQALTNLLANAAQHGAGTPIHVAAWESDDRVHVITSVTNHGPVIPAASLATLFEPFVRGPSARGQGLGLGLSIVRMIATAHGARCEVTSTADDGTTFTITWPRVPLAEVPSRPV